MHVLAFIAIPAIVLTSLAYAPEPPPPPAPRLMELSAAERAQIVAAMAPGSALIPNIIPAPGQPR